MKISYELAKKLKDAGFPQEPLIDTGGIDGKSTGDFYYIGGYEMDMGYGFCDDLSYAEYLKRDMEKYFIIKVPTLSELIEACGEAFGSLNYWPEVRKEAAENWEACSPTIFEMGDLRNEFVVYGSTPEEAVANLWLALNK